MEVVRMLGDWSHCITCYMPKKAGVGMLGRQVVRAALGVNANQIIMFSHSNNRRCTSMRCIGESGGQWQPDVWWG